MESTFRRFALAGLGIAFGLGMSAATYDSQSFAVASAVFSFVAVGLMSRFGLPS
jgi:hypothetical protein